MGAVKRRGWHQRAIRANHPVLVRLRVRIPAAVCGALTLPPTIRHRILMADNSQFAAGAGEGLGGGGVEAEPQTVVVPPRVVFSSDAALQHVLSLFPGGGGVGRAPRPGAAGPAKGKRVPPNGLCPCGAGVKYKKCCGSAKRS